LQLWVLLDTKVHFKYRKIQERGSLRGGERKNECAIIKGKKNQRKNGQRAWWD